MTRFFFSQQQIDRWVTADRVVLNGTRMDLPAIGATVQLRPAVHFLRVIDDTVDPHDLVGRVKTEEQLAAIRAEVYRTSVIVGEVGYESESGFLGEAIRDPRGRSSSAAFTHL